MPTMRITPALLTIHWQLTADLSVREMGRGGEFAEKYLHQGIKLVVTGRIQTGSYTNKDGQRIYTTDVVVEEQEFAESKAAAQNGNGGQSAPPVQSGAADNSNDGFMNIPNGIEEELPFN